jgi:hypothetical protein
MVCKHCHGTREVPGPEECPECCGCPESSCDGVSIVCQVCGGTGRKRVPCHCSGE